MVRSPLSVGGDFPSRALEQVPYPFQMSPLPSAAFKAPPGGTYFASLFSTALCFAPMLHVLGSFIPFPLSPHRSRSLQSTVPWPRCPASSGCRPRLSSPPRLRCSALVITAALAPGGVWVVASALVSPSVAGTVLGTDRLHVRSNHLLAGWLSARYFACLSLSFLIGQMKITTAFPSSSWNPVPVPQPCASPVSPRSRLGAVVLVDPVPGSVRPAGACHPRI